jgi:hypothetical protein
MEHSDAVPHPAVAPGQTNMEVRTRTSGPKTRGLIILKLNHSSWERKFWHEGISTIDCGGHHCEEQQCLIVLKHPKWG